MTLSPEPRDTYNPSSRRGPPPRRKHALVREVKRVIEHSALLDIEPLPDSELDDLTAEARGLAYRLEASPASRASPTCPCPTWRWSSAARSAGRQPSGASGLGRGRRRRRDPRIGGVDGRLRGTDRPPARWLRRRGVRRPDGLAQIASGMGGYTGTLTVKMLRPTPCRRASTTRPRSTAWRVARSSSRGPPATATTCSPSARSSSSHRRRAHHRGADGRAPDGDRGRGERPEAP